MNPFVEPTLVDYGEFRLLREIVFPAITSRTIDADLGDDCAHIGIPDSAQSLVITTDAGPRPLVWSLGYKCYRTWGWFTVLCNASDLAAAAAQPLAFCSSVEAPDSMPAAQLTEFFTGLAEACAEFGMTVAGGNLRSAPRFSAHGTAVGLASSRPFLTRRGARAGDYAIVIGECGKFISTYLQARRNGLQAMSESELLVITRPRPQTRSMMKLKAAGLVDAASDNSDGVLGAVWNICEESKCSAEIEFNEKILPDYVRIASELEGVSPWNILFFWGDYSVIVAVRPERIEEFGCMAKYLGLKYTIIGKYSVGPPALHAITNSGRRPLELLRNENFKIRGYNTDIADHISYMLKEHLIPEYGL